MTQPHPADGATVVRNDEAGRYELRRGEELLAIATFHEEGGSVAIPHTETRADLRGNGIGAVLVAGVLDALRAEGRTVQPRCWFVAQFIEENPAYRDLLA